MKLPLMWVSVAVTLFAVFPLTDTDIWWHLACAREWVTTWTPVREPIVNVHEYFQQTVAFVYNFGGAPLLVAFKAVLWGLVFALFLWPCSRHSSSMLDTWLRSCKKKFCRDSQSSCHSGAFFFVLLFIFRFQFEIRPVLFSLLFLGIYWNILPWLFKELCVGRDSRLICHGAEPMTERLGHVNEQVHCHDSRLICHSGLRAGISFSVFVAHVVLAIQFLWCKFQGLYILGPIFAFVILALEWWKRCRAGAVVACKTFAFQASFVVLLFAMPFFHREGLNLFLYPFGLLDRLLGMSPSAAVFASEIAENRSPITLLMTGENVLQSTLMVVLCVIGIIAAVRIFKRCNRNAVLERSPCVVGFFALWLLVTAILALVAERNFVLFLPVLFAVAFRSIDGIYPDLAEGFRMIHRAVFHVLPIILIAFLLGLWAKSLMSYDSTMVAYQRVPVAATEWMKSHPHSGRLFNDDRAGGYLAFMNPSDSTYIDGRFILKTAEFFERYLGYSTSPQTFLYDTDSLNIDRVVLPLRYYARWDQLLATLDSAENWHVAYHDSLFVVMDRTGR